MYFFITLVFRFSLQHKFGGYKAEKHHPKG